MLSDGTTTVGVDSGTVLVAIAVSSLLMIPALAGWAALSDRIGRRTLCIAGPLITGLWASRCSGWSTWAPR